MTAGTTSPGHTMLMSGRRPASRRFRFARLVAVILVTVLAPVASPGHAETNSGEGSPSASDPTAWAAEVLGILQGVEADPLGTAVSLGKAATALQVRALGGAPALARPSGSHPSPSSAAAALVAAHQVSLTPAQESRLAALDQTPEPARSALTSLMDAFSAFQTATRAAYANADMAALQEAREQLENEPSYFATQATPLTDVLAGVGLDLRPVLSSRADLLDATLAFNTAYSSSSPTAQTPAAGPIQVPGVLSVELDGTDTTYDYTGATVNGLVAAEDYGLLIDVGGNDTYRNNAGGGCGLCAIGSPPQPAAAALVDLRGNDRYVSGRPVGINGGASFGAGFLLDVGGDDTYTAGSGGTNGGGVGGSGLLVDGSGNDSYSAGDFGTNGGSGIGTGVLVDAIGYDRYTAGNNGTNGGGVLAIPLLIDGAGNDAYTALQSAVNGGGNAGPGFLLDASGTDAYKSSPGSGPDEGGGANGGGGGNPFGTGLLFDGGGDGDSYLDGEGGSGTDRRVVPKGSNAGVGAQIDVGDDVSMALTVSPSSIPVGGTATATATLRQASTGRPVAGQAVRFDSDRTVGFSPAMALTNAAGEATTTVTGAGSAGTAAVTALADLSSAVATLSEAPVVGPSLTVSDAPPVAEGTFGATGHTQGSARFTMSLSAPAPSTVTVYYSTANGTATGGSDYTASSGTIVFAAEETSKVVSVPVTMDGSSLEGDEDFFLDVSSTPTAVAVADGRGRALIVNDDPASSAMLSVDDVTVTEGNEATAPQAIFTVSVSKPYAAPFTVRAFTSDLTAHPSPNNPPDYVHLDETLIFARDETTKQVAVTINGDNINERDETFALALEDSTGPLREKRQGLGVIVNDDDFPAVSIDDVKLAEGDTGTTEARFTVSLARASFRSISVKYDTVNGTARSTDHGIFGTADYRPASDVVTFAPGDTTKNVVVLVNADTIAEQDEEFYVHLSNAVNAVQVKRVGVGTIIDDD